MEKSPAGNVPGILRLAPAMLLLAGVACGEGDRGTDPGGTSGGPDQGMTDTNAGEVAHPDAGGDAKEPGGDGPDNGREDPGGGYDPGEHELCYDFVCPFDFECIDGHRYYGTTSEPDSDPECPDPCVPDGPFECAEGTWCYDRWDPQDHWRWSPCMPIGCNPSTGQMCDEYHYCDTLMGDCSGPGICASRDEPEHMAGGADDVSGLECGCDGVTYDNWWERAKAAVGARHVGPCCDPANLNFTEDNPDHFEVFVVCANGDLSKSVPENIGAVLAAANFGTQGAWAGCREGESAYVGQLALTGTGAVDPAQYQALCELDSFVDVGGVTGHPAGYCESLPCYDLRWCTELYCPSPCGCCDCEYGKVRCANERQTERCVSAGCWMKSVECTGYDICVSDEAGAGCRPSCDKMDSRLEYLDNHIPECDSPDDCRVALGFCNPEDGPCWLPYNRATSMTEESMTAFQVLRVEAGCIDVETCGCGEPPAVGCTGGNCWLLDFQLPSGK